MPYMIYSQYKTAVIDGYKDRSAAEIREQLDHATKAREWLESLDVVRDVRDVLVEQVNAIAEALEETLRDPHRVQGGEGSDS